jgi:hypothetical protein
MFRGARVEGAESLDLTLPRRGTEEREEEGVCVAEPLPLPLLWVRALSHQGGVKERSDCGKERRKEGRSE